MKKSDTNYNQALIGNNKSLKALLCIEDREQIRGII